VRIGADGVFLLASKEKWEKGKEIILEIVDLQYLAPLSLCYSLTVAQVNVIESTLLSFCYVV
jgi:hypothetical protein